ncbi:MULTISPECIES: MetQ/NlpA family ABC transporter substrate-binding protein [unclassified Caballeronia]|nr:MULTISPECIES: MetQ/NlpA family ABC transporter substrate-binding protein [unclassified Caballeronia]
MPGVEAAIFAHARNVAAKQGMSLELVIFDDAARIDQALANGVIDAASFDDETSLKTRSERGGYAIQSVAATMTLPMAFYSRRLASIASLPHGAIIAIPADAPGTPRALILLQNYALITLKEGAGLHPTLADITGNRFSLNVRRIDHAKLYDALDTASFVAMNAGPRRALWFASGPRPHRRRRCALAVATRACRALRRCRRGIGRATRPRLSVRRRRSFYPHAVSGLGTPAMVTPV